MIIDLDSRRFENRYRQELCAHDINDLIDKAGLSDRQEYIFRMLMSGYPREDIAVKMDVLVIDSTVYQVKKKLLAAGLISEDTK